MDALTIIQDAMKRAKIIDPAETLSNEQAEYNRGRLNDLLDFWSLKRLMVYVLTEDSKVLTIGDGSYTIGSSADIDTVRPIKVDHAFLRDTSITPNVDTGLKIITQDEYNAIPVKGSTAPPTKLYYHPSVANGVIYFDYLPDKAYTLYLYSQKALTEFADLNTDYNFPPGYSAALKANLAVLLADDHEMPVTQRMMDEADSTATAIGGINAVIPKLSCVLVPGSASGSYNVRTDE